MPTGYCPYCCAEVQFREIKPDGVDHCKSGHVFPSRLATKSPRFHSAMQVSRASVISVLNCEAERTHEDHEEMLEWLESTKDHVEQIEITPANRSRKDWDDTDLVIGNG